MEQNSTSPNPNPFAAFLSPVGPFGGRPFLESESLSGHLVQSLQSQSVDEHNAPSFLSPVFQTLVIPQFYINAIAILKKLAQDVDQESKTSLRSFVWTHLFTIVGNQSHSGAQVFAPVIEEAAQNAGQSLIDIEVLFISFLLAVKSYPHYFGPGAVVDHIPSGVFLTQVVEKNVQDFFQVLRQIAAMKQPSSNTNSSPFNSSNQMEISFPSNSNSNSSGPGFGYNTGTPPTTPTQAPAQSPFSSFMIIPQAEGPVFQKFRRSEFNEMTFVTAQLVPEKKVPIKKEEPKSLHELMGSFRIDEWKEWKDETPLATKGAYSSSLARSMKKSRKGSGSTVEATGSGSSSPHNPSPLKSEFRPQPPQQPTSFQFEFNINAPQTMPMDIVPPPHQANAGFGGNAFASATSESPRSSGTHSPSESPRNPFFMGLPSSHNVLRPQLPTLYHSAAPASYMGLTPTAPRPAPQGLSQSDPSGRKRSSSRKSAFREITPGSFSKPTLFQQPEILSLGINTNSNSASTPLSDSRIQILSQSSSRGRSMSAKGPLSKSLRDGVHTRSASNEGFALIAEQSLDNSEAMDIDPAS